MNGSQSHLHAKNFAIEIDSFNFTTLYLNNTDKATSRYQNKINNKTIQQNTQKIHNLKFQKQCKCKRCTLILFTESATSMS